AKRAVIVYRARRLVAVDARRVSCELLRAGRGVDGGARRAFRLERFVDAMGPEGSARGASPAGIVLRTRLTPPVTPVVAVSAAEIGHPHQLRNHAHQLAAATAAGHAHEITAARAHPIGSRGKGRAAATGHSAA